MKAYTPDMADNNCPVATLLSFLIQKNEKGINFLYAVQPNGNFLHWKGGFP